MTFLIERLAELRRYVDHACAIRDRVGGPHSLEADLTLRNDVLFSLLIDIAGELSARRGRRFEAYREAIRNLAGDARFRPDLGSQLELLAGFRNVVVHEYVGIDPVIEALDALGPVDELVKIVGTIESSS